ncbi:MAG: TVP38/TMEM64 family protein [Alphaproteobacteria bacterium]
MNLKILFKGLMVIGSLVALGYVLQTSGLGSSIDKTWIDSDIRGKGLTGELLFVTVGAVFTGLGLPRQLIAFLGGYAFGLTEGTALALMATVIGCVGAFTYARLLGRDFVASRFPNRVRKIDDFLSNNPFSMTLLIRLLPVGSNLVTNLAAGVSGASATAFIGGSTIGYIPQTLIFALIGSGIAVEATQRIAISVVLFVISGILGVRLYRKHRHGKSFDEAIERQLDGDA